MFSAISGLFSGVSFYIILGLASLLSISAYLNYKQIGDIAVLKVAQDSYVEALKSSQNQLEKKDESCKIDDKSLVELDIEKKVIQSHTDSVSNELQKLAIKQSTKEIVKQTIQPIQESQTDEEQKSSIWTLRVLPDDGLLSDNVKRLLWKQYCSSEPADSQCISP